jgi:hypothetical protein
MSYDYPTDCPRCKKPGKVIEAGVSKKTGKPYDEFMACETCRSDDRSLTWKSRAQWQYHSDVAERARRDEAHASAGKVVLGALYEGLPKTGTSGPPKTAAQPPAKAAPKKVSVKKAPTATAVRAPSPAVLQIIFANKVIEALNALKDDERRSTMTTHGYDPKVSKSYVLWVNGLELCALDDLGGTLGIVA